MHSRQAYKRFSAVIIRDGNEREKLAGILKARIEGVAKEQSAAVAMVGVVEKGSSNEMWLES